MSEIVKVIPQEYGIEEDQAKSLTCGLDIALAERESLIAKYKDAMKWEITPLTVSKFAELRLEIKKNRTKKIEEWHKNAKSFFLCGGRFVDALKNKEVAINQEMEAELEKAEKFFINQEIKRLSDLNAERKAIIEPYIEFVFVKDFHELTQEQFDTLLAGAKMQHDAKKEAERIEAEKQAEEKRKQELFNSRRELIISNDLIKFHKVGFINLETTESEFETYFSGLKAQKEAYEAEQKRICEENERLRKEAEAKAKEQAEKDRIAAEELRIANEKAVEAAKEAERLRKESEAKEAARKKEEDERILAEKKAASAPDLKKFQELKKAIEAIQIPDAKGLTAQKFAADCKEMQKRFANKVQEYINQL